MKIVADRIEGGYIVAELSDGRKENLPLVFAPDAKEGDVIDISIDKNSTKECKETVRNRLDRLFDK